MSRLRVEPRMPSASVKQKLVSLLFRPPHSNLHVKKDAFLAQLRAERLIGLVHGEIGPDLIDCAKALSRGGIHCLEIALTTPAAIASVQAAANELPDFRFGLGTVLDVETARLGVLAGASFIVTPSPRPEVITLCRRYHVPVVSGALTRTDIMSALHAGADAVKVFPGQQFGPAYIKTLSAELPGVSLIPIGGVTPTTIAEFLRAGALAAIAGSSLLDDETVRTRNWAAITERAELFSREISLVCT